MVKTFFITGTDTEVGKTFVTRALMQAAAEAGKKVLGYKPVASGCELINGELKNSDALTLQAASSIRLPYAMHNPYAFAPAIAPHIAAEKASETISIHHIGEGLARLKETAVDWIFTEGAGGWRLPLDEQHLLSDWVKKEHLPVILVVGARLGCINHALLTLDAIRHDGLVVAGWVLNRVDPEMSHYEENAVTLKQRIKAPLLGEIPWLDEESMNSANNFIDIAPLLK
ncbi:dethiobiotin synthase [Oceanisphaera arctica]|uniref:ATP-dependent dethiobiotin synthetase BioD n=1 Tax=Oceanisphaera arctica TaxID=641510 RepID=A0A2P5TIK3_9GAMM|nr:dethiobiotin synthase [Oceanisphaera arctica]PPL14590.1 dethiobiotin synthase [Oceanisphaera arctica]GHA17757.1 ATP-dependent dethiobiotin synthetase BioD [Oceanisphaera arctica]